MNKDMVRAVIARRFRFLPPRAFFTVVRLIHGGGYSNFRNPQTYSELLVAKNLTERDPLIPLTADKLAVRDYVAKKVGEEHLIPLVQSAVSADEIDFDKLPEDCVIKGTHGCDMTMILRKGQPVDRDAIRATVRKWLATDFSKEWKEWVYSQIRPRIVIEEFLGNGEQPPVDYKFMVFSGRPAAVQVHEGRFTDHRSTTLDCDWNQIKVGGIFGAADELPQKPDNFEEMLEIAGKLGEDFDYARVDLYNVDGKIYFGEITHFPSAGRAISRPKEMDLAFGQLWLHGTPLPDEFKVVTS